jgi:tRNA1Val (adenine37-N6)-methyltransferase
MGRSQNRKMVFKQFTVQDSGCAMKIGTDAVVLGVVANHEHPLNILDIGTGSGVIALMLSQRFPEANITAIELEPGAFLQALSNFTDSPFNDRLECIESSFQPWSELEANSNKFDLIVSNPPFFSGKPQSPNHARNLARHDDFLSIYEIFEGAKRVLTMDGVLSLVWPVERERDMLSAAETSGFHLVARTEMLPTANHVAVRIIAEFTRAKDVLISAEIILEIGEGQERKFTAEYLKLMSDFFLKV